MEQLPVALQQLWRVGKAGVFAIATYSLTTSNAIALKRKTRPSLTELSFEQDTDP